MCTRESESLLTGFFKVVADDSGVSDGIQKLGSALSRPPIMLDTLDVPAAWSSISKPTHCYYN